jgi:hypothetical protein
MHQPEVAQGGDAEVHKDVVPHAIGQPLPGAAFHRRPLSLLNRHVGDERRRCVTCCWIVLVLRSRVDTGLFQLSDWPPLLSLLRSQRTHWVLSFARQAGAAWLILPSGLGRMLRRLHCTRPHGVRCSGPGSRSSMRCAALLRLTPACSGSLLQLC